jgi:hypothetical protein
MMRYKKLFGLGLLFVCLMSAAHAQESAKKRKATTLVAQTASNPVIGSGAPGFISKWQGVSGSFTYTLGNSNIFDDKFGKVGIGTTAPTSPLTVQGMIETTMGGYKFPDGTVQTTAGLASIFHDATLTGNGTGDSPLGIAPGGVGTPQLANNAVTAIKIAGGTVVRSLNGLFDNIQLAAGSNITITPSGNTLTIAATNALTGVAHNTTLTGNGTQASPLAVSIPLILTGSVIGSPDAVIQAFNGTAGGRGIIAGGGNSDDDRAGGSGIRALGGGSDGTGGSGVEAVGGSSSGFGGNGVSATGGSSNIGVGGIGVSAIGGASSSTFGGTGMFAMGGASSGAGSFGGAGIVASGGSGTNGAGTGVAGLFNGHVLVSGTLSKGAGSFKIDHPLDPENQYLYHSFVESPDMMNVYNGNVVTDANGEAVVRLPDYFEALNRDFHYQLTVIGIFARAIVAEEISGNRFTIKTDAPNVKVSWQVTGVRHDAFANKNRIPVEEAKPDVERGYYLHPEVFNQPEEKSVQWARDPQMMQQLRQKRMGAGPMRMQKENDR